MDRMKELVLQLNKASDAYYNGKEIMSNFEFDALIDELKQLEQESGKVLYDSPTVKVGFAPVNSLPKFKHKFPALSLDKTKDIDEFTSKFKKGIEDSGDSNDNVVLMWKEDGSTVQAYYNEGRLQNLVTRGNGEIGSDITHNAPAIYGIPLRIGFKGELVVRGEALISYDDFNAINEKFPDEEKFKNPRNLASASIQMLDPNEVTTRHVVVKAFNLVYFDDSSPEGYHMSERVHSSFESRLAALTDLGFSVVEFMNESVDKLGECIWLMTEDVVNYVYPVDGLVAAMDNIKYSSTLQGTEHHPHIMQGYAFKWEDEAKETTLREIEWSPSRTGLLNPVAVFDPVEIDGTTVQRASLHNLSVMRNMRIHIGNRLSVYKANLIIPYVDKNLDFDSESDYDDDFVRGLIGTCPTCGAVAEVHVSSDNIETVYCPNEDCPEKMIGKLAHFCSRDCMDIQGMSEETIKKLVDAGFIKEYQDFFTLDEKPGISFLPGFGKQSWKKMCQSAQKARNTDFVHFITALGITNIGKGQAKILYKYISANYDRLIDEFNKGAEDYHPVQLFRIMALQNFDFSVIDGIGDILSDGIIKWAHDHWEFNTPETHVTIILDFTDKRPSTEGSNSSISGKSFCITGKLITFKNRQELVSKIESLGGKWVDSVSSKTDYLINNDVNSTSGKNKKAKNLNIPIISEQDFLRMIS